LGAKSQKKIDLNSQWANAWGGEQQNAKPVDFDFVERNSLPDPKHQNYENLSKTLNDVYKDPRNNFNSQINTQNYYSNTNQCQTNHQFIHYMQMMHFAQNVTANPTYNNHLNQQFAQKQTVIDSPQQSSLRVDEKFDSFKDIYNYKKQNSNSSNNVCRGNQGVVNNPFNLLI